MRTPAPTFPGLRSLLTFFYFTPFFTAVVGWFSLNLQVRRRLFAFAFFSVIS